MSSQRGAGRPDKAMGVGQIVLRPGTMIGAALASLVIGTVLTLIYQGGDILDGHMSRVMVLHLLLTYLVPYAVYTTFAVLIGRNDPSPSERPYAAPFVSAPPVPPVRPGFRASMARREVAAPQANAGLSMRQIAELRITIGAKSGERYSIGAGGLIIGREEDSDIILDDPLVSRHHARVRLQADGYYLEDLGSRNGTALNGEPLFGPSPLIEGDLIAIGQSEMQFRLRSSAAQLSASRPPAPAPPSADEVVLVAPQPRGRPTGRLEVLSGLTDQTAYLLSQPVVTVGRGSDNDIVIKDSLASRRHARITERDGDYFFEDLGSVNGSRINEQRLEGPRRLQPGDVIAVGRVRLLFSFEERY